jgi:hypothetical protein
VGHAGRKSAARRFSSTLLESARGCMQLSAFGFQLSAIDYVDELLGLEMMVVLMAEG